jgi:type IV pilus assembly protein PilO
MAVMADFARLPTQRKVLVFVIAGALIGALYWQFLFKPLKSDIEEAEDQKEARVAQNQKLEQDKKDFTALKLKYCQLKRIIDENQSALPTEAELPAFFETLNRKVLESGVEVHRWNEQKEEPIETFIKVPVQIELTGSYMQIKRFFASLIEKRQRKSTPVVAPTPTDTGCGNSGPVEDRERIVSIESLKLSNPTVVNHEIVLTATFTAATYRKEEAPPDPNAPPPAAKKPAPASAPLPPADTPAGAKARVEKAMDKEEQKKPNVDGEKKLKGGM